MLKISLYLGAVIVSVLGAGELNILHSSNSVKFQNHEQVDESLLKEIFSACLGFTITKGTDWPGLSVSDPFCFSEAIVGIVIDGVPSLDMKEGQRYPLNTDEDESVTWQAMHDRVVRRYPGENVTLLRMDLAEELKPYHHFFGDSEDAPMNWTVKYLDPSVSEDKQFLDEMTMMETVTKRVKNGHVRRDGMPDIFWMVLRSLHPVVDFHGPDSGTAREAKQMLRSAIHRMKEAYIQAFKGQVVVAAICSDVSHTRRTRTLMAESDDRQTDMNLAPEYSADYPVIFNIILWFGVAFVFSLLAISLFIADMDPGRDSIIYRMTSTRMKKDN